MNDPKLQTEEHNAQLVMLDQQLALSAYLQALLKPVDETPAVEPAPAPVTVLPVDIQVVETAVVTEPTLPETSPAAPVAATSTATNPYPDWAQADFQCLLFRVAGLTLALPLAKLNGVLPWDTAAVTAMPGHQPWFLGLREYQGQKVRVIDAAQVIALRAGQASEDSFGKVILIDGGRWGLACEDVAEVVTLTPTAVKWRGQSGNRPWLAGTVIERMCALIDADAFAAMLGGEGPLAA